MAKAKQLPSGQWRCLVYSYTDAKGRRRYESFTAPTRREAEYLAAEFAVNKDRKARPSEMTLGEALEQYIRSKENVLSPGTVRNYLGQRMYFEPIQGTPLRKITNDKIQAWINALALDLSPKSVRNVHGLLSAVLRMYYPEFRLTTSLPARKKPDLYTPSDADVRTLLKHVEGKELELAILLAAFGPLRRGEICALESTDIHGNVITVNKSLVYTKDKEWVLKQPKTYSSYRNIEFPDFVIAKLQGIDGRIVKATPDQITSRFRRAVRFSGVPQFRFHDLRHYAASIMHALGVPDQYIMARGGWSSDGVMKRVYRDTIDEQTQRMNHKIFEHFGAMQHEMQHENEKPLKNKGF